MDNCSTIHLFASRLWFKELKVIFFLVLGTYDMKLTHILVYICVHAYTLLLLICFTYCICCHMWDKICIIKSTTSMISLRWLWNILYCYFFNNVHVQLYINCMYTVQWWKLFSLIRHSLPKKLKQKECSLYFKITNKKRIFFILCQFLVTA